jgi:hypothetical protein
MSPGQIWSVALGTALALGIVLALFVIRKLLREKFFPSESTSSREQTLTALLLLQARMEGQLSGRSRPSTETKKVASGLGEGSAGENGPAEGFAEAHGSREDSAGTSDQLGGNGGVSRDAGSDPDRRG